ncbi:MAG: hypothetical protein AB8D52_07970 [Gammaproteobacteria bacterium]
MLAGKQNIKLQDIDEAVRLLQSEARYFDQLSRQFTDYERVLKKHSADCSFAVKKILQNGWQEDNSDNQPSSLRTANAFLAEGRRLRLKLRINHLKQEATGLELEAGRLPELESEFKILAEDCREIVSVCKNSVDIATIPEIEDLLATASNLYDKSVNLRQAQKIKLREEAVTFLMQRVHILKEQADILQRNITAIPSRSTKYKQLSTHCLQVAHRFEAKIESASLFELTRAIETADDFIARIRHSQKKNKFPDTTNPELSESTSVLNLSKVMAEPELSEVTAEPEPPETIADHEPSEVTTEPEPSEATIDRELKEATSDPGSLAEVTKIEKSDKEFFPAALRTVIDDDARRSELERKIAIEKRSMNYQQSSGAQELPEDSHSFFGLTSHFFAMIISSLLAVINYFISGLAQLLKNVVKFLERIFMFLIVGIGAVTIVFVVAYLTGSGYDNIGFLDFIAEVIQQ